MSALVDFGVLVWISVGVLLFFFFLSFSLCIRYCSRNESGTGADWDDVVWFRMNDRLDTRSFTDTRMPGRVTPRRRSLNEIKLPHNTNSFELRSYGEIGNNCVDESCCICLEEYSSEDKLKKLPCGHWLHSDCIEKWFTRDVTCPLCKTVTIAKPYAADVGPDMSLDSTHNSETSSQNGNSSRRPSLTTMIREALERQGEIFVVYRQQGRNQSSNASTLRNLVRRMVGRRPSIGVEPTQGLELEQEAQDNFSNL